MLSLEVSHGIFGLSRLRGALFFSTSGAILQLRYHHSLPSASDSLGSRIYPNPRIFNSIHQYTMTRQWCSPLPQCRRVSGFSTPGPIGENRTQLKKQKNILLISGRSPLILAFTNFTCSRCLYFQTPKIFQHIFALLHKNYLYKKYERVCELD